MRTAAPVDIGSATMPASRSRSRSGVGSGTQVAAGADEQDLDVGRLGEDPGEAPLVDASGAGASQP